MRLKSCAILQEAQVMDSIEEYFDHRVAEIPSDDEDKFEQVLVEAGLSHGIDGWSTEVRYKFQCATKHLEAVAQIGATPSCWLDSTVCTRVGTKFRAGVNENACRKWFPSLFGSKLQMCDPSYSFTA